MDGSIHMNKFSTQKTQLSTGEQPMWIETDDAVQGFNQEDGLTM